MVRVPVTPIERIEMRPANQQRTPMDWDEGEWFNPPPWSLREEAGLRVGCAPGSDFWRTTHYGFVRDSGHALLRGFRPGTAIQVGFVADFDHLYDQAGLFVRVDERTWIKAGVEVSDGGPRVGAVVTHDKSDWSSAPVPHWAGREVTVRASWADDALTVRARVGGEAWEMVRLTHLPARTGISAGIYCASPEHGGMSVRFTRWSSATADAGLHDPGL